MYVNGDILEAKVDDDKKELKAFQSERFFILVKILQIVKF